MVNRSQVIAELLGQCITGAHRSHPPARILAIDLPPIDFEPLARQLSALGVSVYLAYLDVTQTDLPHFQSIAERFGFRPGHNLAWTVEVAEHWRNTLLPTNALVVVARSDQPKLTSFNEFQRVTARELKRLLCDRAIHELSQRCSSNDVLQRWWRLVDADDALAFTSVLDYYLAVQGCPLEEYVMEVGKQLYRLGLLPDRHLLDNPDYQAIKARVDDNHRLIAAIKELCEGDRQAIIRGIARPGQSPEERTRLERAFRLISTLYDGGIGALSHLEYRDVVDLMQYRRKHRSQPRGPDRTRTQVKPLETRVLEWLLQGDETHMVTLFDQLRLELEGINTASCKEEEQSIPDPSDPGGIRLTFKVLPKLFQVYESCLGDSLAAIVDLQGVNASDASQVVAAFSPTFISDQWQDSMYRDFLVHFARLAKGQTVHDCFVKWVELRRRLSDLLRVCAVAPILACAQPTREISDYIETYKELLLVLEDAYGDLNRVFLGDASEFVARFLLLDTVVVRIGEEDCCVLLGPLHPLYLWHAAEMCRLSREQRDKLDEEEKGLVIEASSELPNFLSVLCVGRPVFDDSTRVLLPTGRMGSMPYYARKTDCLTIPDGKQTIGRWLRAFIRLYPHARMGLRVAAVNPPSPGDLLTLLCELAKDGSVEGAHLIVVRFLDDSDQISTLRVSSDEERDLSEFFKGAGRDPSFTFDVMECTKADWAEFVRKNIRAHVLVIFDLTPGRLESGAPYDFPVQPLAVPRRFHYRIATRQVDLLPAPADVFGTFFRLAERVDSRALPFTSITHQDQALRGILNEIADSFLWVIMADRRIDRDLKAGELRVASAREGQRDLAVFAHDKRRFRRILREVVRQYNTAVTDEQLDDLLDELSDLLEEGLLSIIPHNGANDHVTIRALLGTLIAARWYWECNGEAMLVSLDSHEARRWLRLRADNRRADLLGVRIVGNMKSPDLVVLDVLEVKTSDGDVEVQDGTIGGEAVRQLIATKRVLDEVFGGQPDDRVDERMVTPARREVLREHFYRECSKRRYALRRSEWVDILNRLFDRDIPFRVELSILRVWIGRSVDSTPRDYKVAGQEELCVHVTNLNERTVGVGGLSLPGQAGAVGTTGPVGVGAQEAGVGGEAEGQRVGSPQTMAELDQEGSDGRDARAWLGHVLKGARREEAWFLPDDVTRPLPNPHVIVTGATGTGKTQVVKAIVHDLRKVGVPTLILDFKDDYCDADYAHRERLTIHEVAVVGLPLNPLALMPDPRTGMVSPVTHAYAVSGIMKRVFNLGTQQEHRLREAMKSLYRRSGIELRPSPMSQPISVPPFSELRPVLEHMEGSGELLGRIAPLFDLDIFRGGPTQHLEELFSGSSVVRLTQLPSDEVKNAVGEFLLLSLYNFLVRREQPHRLRTVLVLDEAWRLASSPFLEPLMREGRAFGLGVIIATQFLKDLPDVIIGCAATRVYLGINQPESIKANLRALVGKTTGPDAERLARMFREFARYQGIIESPHFQPYAVLQVVPYFERVGEAR